MCDLVIDAMAEEIEALKARCARLRAALAGVVLGEDAANEPCVEVLAYAIEKVRGISGDRQDEKSPLPVAPRDLIAALEVLRETAPTKEVSDGV